MTSVFTNQDSRNQCVQRYTNFPLEILSAFCFYVVTCRDIDWLIRFIDTLYTQVGTTGNYSAISDLRTLKFTAANTSVLRLLQSPLSFSWQRVLTQKLYSLHYPFPGNGF
jgi:hypothetical protein